MKWSDVLSATHGVFFASQDQADAWEQIFREEITDLKRGEVQKALKEAVRRDEQTKNFRMTAYDVVDWVKRSRRNWQEKSYQEEGWEYFPDRPHICGQIQKRKIQRTRSAAGKAVN